MEDYVSNDNKYKNIYHARMIRLTVFHYIYIKKKEVKRGISNLRPPNQGVQHRFSACPWFHQILCIFITEVPIILKAIFVYFKTIAGCRMRLSAKCCEKTCYNRVIRSYGRRATAYDCAVLCFIYNCFPPAMSMFAESHAITI